MTTARKQLISVEEYSKYRDMEPTELQQIRHQEKTAGN